MTVVTVVDIVGRDGISMLNRDSVPSLNTMGVEEIKTASILILNVEENVHVMLK